MYQEAAGFYDRLTSDIDYVKYAGFFRKVFERHTNVMPVAIVDLGCGTGSLTAAMSDLGFDMTGVDSSPEMLSHAVGKVGKGALWINQDFTELDLFGTYDAAVSLLDCFNHILEPDLLKKSFNRIKHFIIPGGLFVFDINTEFKFREIYGNNVFYAVEDDFSYIWQNDYDSDKRICRMDITVFSGVDGHFVRSDLTNEERMYDVSDLKLMLDESGFTLEAVYGDGILEEPDESEERIFLVCRRKEVA